jgi:hypothetical protein
MSYLVAFQKRNSPKILCMPEEIEESHNVVWDLNWAEPEYVSTFVLIKLVWLMS